MQVRKSKSLGVIVIQPDEMLRKRNRSLIKWYSLGDTVEVQIQMEFDNPEEQQRGFSQANHSIDFGGFSEEEKFVFNGQDFFIDD